MKTVAVKSKKKLPAKKKRVVYAKSKSESLCVLELQGKRYHWSNNTERLQVIRKGIEVESIEEVGSRLNLPIKSVLHLVGIPQTTYNLKKKQHALLDSHNTELLVMIIEVLDFGKRVFNLEEEKFQRWLKKPNRSLGGHTPESFFDTLTGILEVRHCLNRLEYGNFA
jgi:putative toxin-antitoxin system antitoxin component (TIGR02293 family)